MMKKIKLFVLALQVCICVYAQDFTNPVKYMDACEKATVEMDQKYMAYISATAHGKRARKVEKLRKQVIESIEKAKVKLMDLPYFNGDKTSRQEYLDYVQVTYNIFTDDYEKVVNIEEISERSFDQMEAYMLLKEKIDEKLKESSQKLSAAYKKFAEANKVNLVEGTSKLGEKMAIASKVHKYYNKLSLLFFKPNWQDNEMIDALNKNKLNEVEQIRNALIKYANEAIPEIKKVPAYEGDNSLATTCISTINALKEVAEKIIPKLNDYFLKKENFEKVKKAFDSKSSSERKKEDIDAYNKAVNEMNEASNKYNQLNAEMNAKRNQAYDEWEKASKAFLDNYVPKYR